MLNVLSTNGFFAPNIYILSATFDELHFFWLSLLQGGPCLEVRRYNKDSVVGFQICKMLIDLKVTNEIHSSEFAKAHKNASNPNADNQETYMGS